MRPFTLALFALLSGCSTDPDEIFPVRGTLVGAGALEGQQVQLLRTVLRQEDPFAFEVCDPSLAVPFQDTAVDSNGAYQFEVLRAEGQSFTTGTRMCFRAQTTFPSGSRAWSDFDFEMGKFGIADALWLGRFHDWRSGMALDGGVLAFEPVIPWPNDNPPMLDPDGGPHFEPRLVHRATVTTADGGVIWRNDDQIQLFSAVRREPIEIDALRLEDFSGSVSLQAQLAEPVERPSGRVFPQVYLVAADRLPLQGSLVPLSRGLPCPELGDPCPLTDGKLIEGNVGSLDRFTFELRTPSAVSTVVLRGLVLIGPAIEVELTLEDGGISRRSTTLDRSSWYEPTAEIVRLPDGSRGAATSTFIAIGLDAGIPAQRVTVRFPDGILRASEFSIFAP